MFHLVKKNKILIKTTRKAMEVKCSAAKEAEEWLDVFQKALKREKADDDNGFQVRPRNNNDSVLSIGETLAPGRVKRSSLLSLKPTPCDIQILFEDSLAEQFGAKSDTYTLDPKSTTGQDVITSILSKVAPEEPIEGYHLHCEGSDWPLYGSKPLWENSEVRQICISCQQKTPVFTLVKVDVTKRYSRVPSLARNSGSSSSQPVVIKVKFPSNSSHLSRMSQNIDFNTTTVDAVIGKSLQKLMRSTNARNRNSVGPRTTISTDTNEWMLRVFGSDIHLFGDGLLAEYPVVREAYDNSGSISFQLLRIKPQAQGALKRGEGSVKIYRFYAFSYGFMRDIIYRQLLPAQRRELHKLCYENVKAKLEDADGRGSVLEILQHRHEFISKADMI